MRLRGLLAINETESEIYLRVRNSHVSIASPLCSTMVHLTLSLGGEKPSGSERYIPPIIIPVKRRIVTQRERINRPKITRGFLLANKPSPLSQVIQDFIS